MSSQNRAGRLARYAELVPMCERSLIGSFDRSRNLFAHQLHNGVWAPIDSIYPHETLTSSCIALIGLARQGGDFAAHRIDAEAVITAILGEVQRTGYEGGLGLVLWANAVIGGQRTAVELLDAVGRDLSSLDGDIRPTLTTMELAWLASGLLHELHRSPSDGPISQTARRTVNDLISSRYVAATRLMRHAGRTASPMHRLRSHIANFADQIYPIQALAFAGLVLDDQTAFNTANQLAQRHAELQGPRGQWWWHFDARRGHVALRYSVYSVHQHGMAPMGLMAVTAAGGSSFDNEITKSLTWIDDNEAGSSLVDPAASTIWRDIAPTTTRVRSLTRGALETIGVHDSSSFAPLAVNRETRPYEWAWCMYAGAIDAGLDRGASIV